MDISGNSVENRPAEALGSGDELKTVAAGPWLRVGTFHPLPNRHYLVQGTLRRGLILGQEIESDHLYAAEVFDDPHTEWLKERERLLAVHNAKSPTLKGAAS